MLRWSYVATVALLIRQINPRGRVHNASVSCFSCTIQGLHIYPSRQTPRLSRTLSDPVLHGLTKEFAISLQVLRALVKQDWNASGKRPRPQFGLDSKHLKAPLLFPLQGHTWRNHRSMYRWCDVHRDQDRIARIETQILIY